MRTRELVALSKRFGRHMPVIADGTLTCSICGHTRSSVTHSLIHSNRTFMSVAAEQEARQRRKAGKP